MRAFYLLGLLSFGKRCVYMPLLKRMFRKESLETYLKSDAHFSKSLTAKDLIGLGIGAVLELVFLFCQVRLLQRQPDQV